MTESWTEWSDRMLLMHVDTNGKGLNEWEIEFVESLFKALKEYEGLTHKQRQKLEQIAEERVK